MYIQEYRKYVFLTNMTNLNDQIKYPVKVKSKRTNVELIKT